MSRSQDWFDQGNLASNNKIHKQEKSVGENDEQRMEILWKADITV